MLSSSVTALSVLVASLLTTSVVQANNHAAVPHARHRFEMREANSTEALEKRDNVGASNARFTYYDTSVGLGSCGIYHANSEYTVALNSDQTNAAGGGYPSPLCGLQIGITYGGKTTYATIQDECPTCPWGGLDLSEGLFSFFADQSVGVLYGTWWYTGSNGDSSPATTSTTPAWTPTTTSTWQAPTTTSTPAWTPATTSTSTSQWVAPTTSTSTSQWVAPTTSSTSSTSTYVAPSSSAAWSSAGIISASGSYYSAYLSGSGSSATSVYQAVATDSAGNIIAPPATLSGLVAPSASAGIAATAGNNLQMIAEVVGGFGGVVCNGNAHCV